MSSKKANNQNLEGIAIIGMAGKFPGVENIYEYWDAIIHKKELLKRFTDEELSANSVDEETKKHKHFVPVNGLIHTAEYFDSSFFGFTPREADLTDPQHRKFLEVSYEALEHAGQSPDNYNGAIGVFAGCSMNNYLLKNLLQYPELLRNNGEFQTIVNNDKDFLTTKVSYKLDLTGPSFDIQTACSTSLVAIHVACQNLLNYQCDIALGGGAFVMNPRGHGYMFKPGGIESAIGTCRPFDIDAEGTVFGEGVGVIVLKRLEDAVADKDEIWAVIRSSAINNDGSFKVGYMAPSTDGQAEAISMAMEFGDIDAKTISYIEAHGTGTKLGDPIEISGLTKVYRKYTDEVGYCAIGSVKGNIGHCDVASGVAGIIKTALALKYKKLPPSINYESANPELQLHTTPFYVNTELKDWEVEGIPRRAAISSFGIGGTNAHCILEEWDENVSVESEKEIHLLPLSAKNTKPLDKMIENLVDHVRETKQNLADIAHTLQTGRNFYAHRAMLVGKSKKEIANIYSKENKDVLIKGKEVLSDPSVIFMFTGQGSQYINMAKGLYNNFELFKNIVDDAHDILLQSMDINLRELLFNDPENKELVNKVNLTSNTQPLLFVVQYATACLLMECGIFPDALTGHSIGEITAATLSGVFSFEDALKVVASRGKIMQAQQPGSMLSVNLPVEELTPLLNDKVEISLQNAPGYCVISGSDEDIIAFEKEINSKIENLHTTILKTSHAFHSKLMEPALGPFKKVFDEIEFNEPEIPFISNVTGTWITKEEACNPQYWADHIRSMVNFAGGINEIFQSEQEVLFMEIGPGNSLSLLLSQFDTSANFKSISTIRHPRSKEDDIVFFYKSIADYWVSGGKIEWNGYYEDENRFKVPLPTYPFELKRHWIDPKVYFNIYTGIQSEVKSIDQAENIGDETEHVKPALSALHKRPDLASEYIAPSSPTEKKVVEIWQELLGVGGIGIQDDFFELGGHSLLASQLMVRINENFNVKLPLDSIFNSPTASKLIQKFDLEIPSGAGKVEIKKKVADYYPLSPEQKRLWLINKIDQNNPAYNIPFTYKLTGEVNIEALNKSFETVTERHLTLKSYIDIKDDEPVARINKEVYSIKYIDSTDKKIDNIDTYVQEIIGKDTRESFDLTNGPLIRATLIKTGTNEYVFHITIQHIVFDGWSWGIFSKEISEVYNSICDNKQTSLPELNIQYFDFSQWQIENQDKLIDQKSVDFWTNQLKDIPVETKFPYDYKRPDVISGLGGRENITINEELSQKIRELSRENGTTVFMTMLTAFGTLINLYSNENDICIGTPTANRTRSDFEKLIGFFVNTIVFRLKLDRSLSFKDILNNNKKSFLDSLEHQDLPFEKLVDILQPERIMNINPLFQIMFAWQNAPRPPLSFNNIEQSRLVVKNGISPLDITFYMWENNGIIEGEIEFNADILERESINHLKDNFIRLLNEISLNSEKPVQTFDCISDYTRAKIDEFNDTRVNFDDRLLHELFEDMASQYPADPAVVSGDKKLSYQELNERANGLAHQLMEIGVQGEFVGISLPRTEHMLITVLAILKAGATYLPLDPEFPDERLIYILNDSKAKLLITNKNLKSKFKGVDCKIILIDKGKSLFKSRKVQNTNPQLKIKNDSLAYTIYTSGSTGNPKGVKVPHYAAVNFINSMAKVPGMDKQDKLLAVTTLSFDISVLELFLPISVGACVVIATNEQITNGNELINTIENNNISILQATPTTWNLLLLSNWKGNNNLKALCGGEALPQNLSKELVPKVKELWNMYGPTETTVWSSCYMISDPNEPILVGKPIDNTQIYILNEQHKELPIGVFGEVCIGGRGVTLGYHNRSALTNEKFIRFGDNEVIYKTGDWGRILSSGKLELARRIDNQIKLRGFRIEPGEIEALISKIQGATEAVVKVQEFGKFDERLVAFVRCESPSSMNEDHIKLKLSSKLPKYMIPSNFSFMEEFPKTPNGKVDRKALVYNPDDVVPSGPDTSIELATTETELKIAQVWKQVLKTKSIGINKNFFNIGGNSLLALTVVEKVQKLFDVEFNPRIFFDSPNIKDLAQYLDLNILDNSGSEEKDGISIDAEESNIIEGSI